MKCQTDFLTLRAGTENCSQGGPRTFLTMAEAPENELREGSPQSNNNDKTAKRKRESSCLLLYTRLGVKRFTHVK